MKTIYVPLRMDATIFMTIDGIEKEYKLNYAEGMIGAIAVFEDEELANKFADGRFQVMECTAGEPNYKCTISEN